MSAIAKSTKADTRIDAVTDLVDEFLKNGLGAVEGWVGPTAANPQCVASYVQGCATVYASLTIAQAIDRLTARIDRMLKVDHEGVPPKKLTTTASSGGRDPELQRIKEHAALATPMPQALRDRLTELKAGNAQSLPV